VQYDGVAALRLNNGVGDVQRHHVKSRIMVDRGEYPQSLEIVECRCSYG
jgi:hypothetical protein